MAEIDNFVEVAVEAAVEETTPEEIIHSFATIGAVTETGVTLIFDGETEASTKEYLCNTSILFQAGQRVKLCRDSGTYVVEYIVGAPKADKPPQYVPAGGSDGQYLVKNGAANYSLTWGNKPHDLPTGGAIGYMLVKNSAGNYDVKWVAAPSERIPSGGSNNQLLVKNGTTDYSLKWADEPHDLPTGGNAGYMLVKNSGTNYDVKWTAAPSERIPTGGSDGQYLAKDGSTNYALKWVAPPSAPVVSQLKSGSYTLSLNSSRVLLPSGSGFAIGSSDYPIDLHTDSIRLYYSKYTYVTLTCNSSGKLCVDGTAIN